MLQTIGSNKITFIILNMFFEQKPFLGNFLVLDPNITIYNWLYHIDTLKSMLKTLKIHKLLLHCQFVLNFFVLSNWYGHQVQHLKWKSWMAIKSPELLFNIRISMSAINYACNKEAIIWEILKSCTIFF